MGVTGHEHTEVFLSLVQEHALKLRNQARELLYGTPQIESLVQGYLIIPAPGSMQLPAQWTDFLDQPLLNGQMNILKISRKLEFPGPDFPLNGLERRPDTPRLRGREDPGSGEHFNVCNTAGDVFTVKPFVKING